MDLEHTDSPLGRQFSRARFHLPHCFTHQPGTPRSMLTTGCHTAQAAAGGPASHHHPGSKDAHRKGKKEAISTQWSNGSNSTRRTEEGTQK